MLTSTTFAIDHHEVLDNLGVVRGITVRSRSIIGQIGTKIETLFGGNISTLTTLCEKTRQEAFDIMCAHAQKLGANAIIGVRYDATELLPGVSEVLCYGTAVVVEELPRALPGGR